MKNKVSVKIAGLEYTLVASEDASYMEKVAQHVDAKVNEVMAGGEGLHHGGGHPGRAQYCRRVFQGGGGL